MPCCSTLEAVGIAVSFLQRKGPTLPSLCCAAASTLVLNVHSRFCVSRYDILIYINFYIHIYYVAYLVSCDLSMFVTFLDCWLYDGCIWLYMILKCLELGRGFMRGWMEPREPMGFSSGCWWCTGWIRGWGLKDHGGRRGTWFVHECTGWHDVTLLGLYGWHVSWCLIVPKETSSIPRARVAWITVFLLLHLHLSMLDELTANAHIRNVTWHNIYSVNRMYHLLSMTSIHSSVYPPIDLWSIHPPIHPPIHPSIHPSIHLHVYLLN